MGLVIIGAMALYLLISILVVTWVISHARKRRKSATRWGLGAALVMYLIPFWDWIPTAITHHYYCESEAGLKVYKTLEQWDAENPGVLKTLSMSHLPEQYRDPSYSGSYGSSRYLLPDGTILDARRDVNGRLMYVEYRTPKGARGYRLNERFSYSLRDHLHGPQEHELFINVWRWEKELTDTKTGEVLARETTFTSGNNGYVGGTHALKFWLTINFSSDDSFGKCSRKYFRNGSIHEYLDKLRVAKGQAQAIGTNDR